MYVGSPTLTDARAELQHRATGTGVLLPGDESGPPRAPIDLDPFYRKYEARLRRTFASMVRDLPGIDAEEVLQETMSRASKEKLDRFPTDTDLLRWCTRVGINYIAKQAGTLARRMEELHPDPDSVAGSRPAQVSENLEDHVILRAELLRIFPQLQPKHREVLLLDATDHSYDQMAEILKISRDAVSKRLGRARAAAQRILGPLAAGATVLSLGRKILRGWGRPPHPIAASVMSVAMAAVLVVPVPGGGTAGAVLRRILAAPGDSVIVVPSAPYPTPRPTGSSDHRLRSAPTTASPRNARQIKPKRHLLPHLPKTCGPDMCAGPCPDLHDDGDRLYVKPIGYCVNESVAPTCEYVPDNPAVGCERTGDPQWLIGPPPSPIPKGEPL